MHDQSPRNTLAWLQRSAGNQAVNQIIGNRGTNRLTVQRETEDTLETTENLGRHLLTGHGSGVSVAFYDADRSDPEFQRQASVWASRENAGALSRVPGTAGDISFGKAMPDSLAIAGALPAMSKHLRAGVEAVFPAPIRSLAALHPATRIRMVALFSHGTTDWMSVGTPELVRSRVSQLAGAIAPYLAADAKVILYACNVARGKNEREEWVKGTMEPGGAESLAGDLRDALLAAGLPRIEVWGHTTTGHTTDNPALRVFRGDDGAGSAGMSYVTTTVFPASHMTATVNETLDMLRLLGYPLSDAAVVRRIQEKAEKLIQRLQYKCWIDASVNKSNDPTLKLRGENLAEMAPLYPEEVAVIVRKYWSTFTWSDTRRRKKLIDQLTPLARRSGRN